MVDELTICTAAFFRSIGKDVATSQEFIMGASLELKWMPPSDAKRLLQALVTRGIVTESDGFVRPASDLSSIDVPIGYRPPKDIIPSGAPAPKCQTSGPAPSGDAPADVFPTLMALAVSAGMDRRDFIKNCNTIQKKLNIEIGVAALIVLRDAGTDITPYVETVYDSIRKG